MNKTSGQPNLTFFWWVMWGALTASAVLLFIYFPKVRARPATAGSLILPLLPLVAAILVRWVWLPRIAIPTRASPVFFLGLLMAAACGAMGMILAPDLRFVYAVLAVAGLLQYVPLFASKYYS